MQAEVSTSSVQVSLESRIGKKKYTLVLGLEQTMYVVCMIIILRCILYRPTLFSLILLIFLMV